MSTKPKAGEQGGALGSTKGPFRDVQRGTQNELEILGMIVAVSPNIRQIVLDQIRKAKKRLQDREKKAAPIAE